jgi:hypothetical protein
LKLLALVISLSLLWPSLATADDGSAVGQDEAWFTLPESQVLAPARTRLTWNYTFLRGNRDDQVFNADQTLIGTRRNRRKTHLIEWRLHRGLTERLQAEAEIVYQAYRQHTHSDGDAHDRNDDGDFERYAAGLSYQALRESARQPAVRLRGGMRFPNRAENEGIGQELGFELLAASGKRIGAARVTAMAGGSITFDNHDQPADPIFTGTPYSKGHDLRTLVYGVGVAHPLHGRWRVHLELDGRVVETIRLNRRVHQSRLTATPGLIWTAKPGTWDAWVGFGVPIGLTDETDHVGIAIRTGVRF